MTDSRGRGAALALGLYLAIATASMIGAGIVLARRAPAALPAPGYDQRDDAPIPAAQPIASEIEVFRTNPGVLAIPPGGARLRIAHPRTLVRYRGLRAYPGAPPRIPHGFTADEFRTGACNTCHKRGGYSPRFGAYVPVTPHPDMPACLQCHVGNDAVTGVTLPNQDPSTVCLQCHAPGASRWADASVDWRPMAWPQVTRARMNNGMPPIAHDLFFRGNCLTCHSGPSAVAEIRTPHPERAECRQCHVVADPAVSEFARPAATPPGAPGGN